MSLNKLKLSSSSESGYDFDDENQDLALLLSNQQVEQTVEGSVISSEIEVEPALDISINWDEVALIDIPRRVDEIFVSYIDINSQPHQSAIDLINAGEAHLKEKLASALDVIDISNDDHTEQFVIISHIIDRMKSAKYSFSNTLLEIEATLNSKQKNELENETDSTIDSIEPNSPSPSELDLSAELDSQPFINEVQLDNNDERDLIAQFNDFNDKVANMLSNTITFEDAKRTLDEYAKITSINPVLFANNSELISRNLICKRNINKIKEAGIVYQFNSAIDKVTNLSEAQRLQTSFNDYFSKINNSQSIVNLSSRLNDKIRTFTVQNDEKAQSIEHQDQAATADTTIHHETLNAIQDDLVPENGANPTTSGISNSLDNIPLYSGKSSLITRTGASVDYALNKLISRSIGYTDFVKSKESTKYIKGDEVVQVTSSFKTLRGLTIHATENSFEFETIHHSRAAGAACKLATLKGWRHITAWGSEAFIEELTSKAKPLGIEVFPVNGNLLNKLHSAKPVSTTNKVVELRPTTSTLQVKPNANPETHVNQNAVQPKAEYKGFSHDAAQKLANNEDANVSPTRTLG